MRMSKRITVTLPDELADRVRKKARQTGRPVSGILAEALRKSERDEFNARLAEQYRAAAEEAKAVAEEWWPLVEESWPDDEAR
jgi:predicted transcriptional regulator